MTFSPTNWLSRNRGALFVGMAVCLATLALHAIPTAHPFLVQDDGHYLLRSAQWGSVWANFWVPANEHAMPLGRVSSRLLIQAAGRPTLIPYAAGLHGVVAMLACLFLVYLFVRRELGHPFHGLAAITILGVTSVYQQAVTWFSASFAILALDCLLLGLLAAQRWRQTGRARHLVLCALWCAVSPAFFASGILAGPLCCLYLLPWPWSGVRGLVSGVRSQRSGGEPLLRRALWLTPMIGTALFLTISLPLTAPAILYLEHYGEKNAVSSFDPRVGLLATGRSVVENLALGMAGIGGIDLSPAAVVAGWVVLSVAGALWWWSATDRRLLLLGLGFIFGSYLLTYSARAEWIQGGAAMNQPAWSRYHLYPHLGLTLFLAGGLPRWQRWLNLSPDGMLSRRQTSLLLGLVLVLFVIQVPRVLAVHWPRMTSVSEEAARLREDPLAWAREVWTVWRDDPGRVSQADALRRVEEIDQRCRQHRIGRDTARAALGRLPLPHCDPRENVWDLLHGSDDPLPLSVEKARELLQP